MLYLSRAVKIRERIARERAIRTVETNRITGEYIPRIATRNDRNNTTYAAGDPRPAKSGPGTATSYPLGMPSVVPSTVCVSWIATWAMNRLNARAPRNTRMALR